MVQDASPSQAAPHYPPWLAEVSGQLAGLKVGGNLLYRSVTASTNDDARNLAHSGAPDGLVVVADCQTHGRGRLGRTWVSPPDSSLLLSALFRYPAPLSEACHLSMIVGLAAADAIDSVAGANVELKWPNDLLIFGRKVGGILSEIQSVDDRLQWAVVGLGINVSADFSTHPDLSQTAISLQDAVDHEVGRGPLLVALIRGLSCRYARLRAGESPLAEWSARLGTLGRSVDIDYGQTSFTGTAESVTIDGSLVVRLADGSRREISAGEVRLRTKVG